MDYYDLYYRRYPWELYDAPNTQEWIQPKKWTERVQHHKLEIMKGIGVTMSAKKQGNRYTKEFKQQLVDLYHANHSVLELSRDYGPSTVTIYKWINEMKVVATATGEQITTKELAALQKKIRELEIENEILKKATAIFAKGD